MVYIIIKDYRMAIDFPMMVRMGVMSKAQSLLEATSWR